MEASRPVPAQRTGFFRTLWRLARQLFHETTGAVFFLLAISWTAATFRLWRAAAPSWLLAVCGGFAVILIGFGLTSFRSARRVR